MTISNSTSSDALHGEARFVPIAEPSEVGSVSSRAGSAGDDAIRSAHEALRRTKWQFQEVVRSLTRLETTPLSKGASEELLKVKELLRQAREAFEKVTDEGRTPISDIERKPISVIARRSPHIARDIFDARHPDLF